MAIVAMIAGVTVPFYIYFQTFSLLESAKSEVTQQVILAQEKAKSGYQDSSHGVYFSNNQFIVFQGTTYASRDQAEDVIYSLPANVSFSETKEIDFAIKSALPAAPKSISIIHNALTDIENITVNAEGLVY